MTSGWFQQEKALDWIREKNHDCVHLWVKFCIQNVVLGVSRRKDSEIFPCRAFYSCVFNEMFIEVP